jgi:thioredoxin 1
MDELEKLRKQKLEQYKQQFVQGGKNMDNKWPNTPIDMSDNDVETFTKQYKTVVVDCWAPWCAPCQIVGPIIEELARDYAGRVLFGKLNVDENREVAMQYQIMGIPTLLVFKNGELVDRIVGAMPKQTLERKITRHL